MKKIIIIGVAVVLLLAIAGGAAFFFLGGSPDEALDAEIATGEAGEASAEKLDPPIYHGLDPDFVIAFQNPKSVRFVKASIEVMVRDDEVIDALKLHMPVIRDGIIMLFSTQTEDDLVTAEGKEKFRALILQEIRGNLEELTGNPGVEAVYFSNFVMQ
jgi:flagellar FliL protein